MDSPWCPDNYSTYMIWLLIVGDYIQGLTPTGPVHMLGEVGKCKETEDVPEVGPGQAL